MTVEALRRRRPATLGDLLEAYGRELQSVAYLILRDRAEAEDVLIETLLTAFERGGTVAIALAEDLVALVDAATGEWVVVAGSFAGWADQRGTPN